mgnify:CR=1 FL=1
MDEVRMVRDLYPEPAPPTAQEIARAKALLEEPPRGFAARRFPPRRLRWGFGGVVAAGAAAAVAIAFTGGNAPGRGGGSTTLDGRAAVLAAAERAERQPTGRYWHSDVVDGQAYVVRAKTGTYAITGALTETFGWWGAERGMGEGHYGRDLPARPQTAHDALLWRKAGAPSVFRVWSDGRLVTYGGAGKPEKWRKDGPERGTDPRGGGRFLGGRSVEDLRTLPTDPAELATLFLSGEDMRRATGVDQGANPGVTADAGPGAGPEADPVAVASGQIMRVASILGGSPVPPKVRAGLMRALADRPGIHPIGRVTDPLGRRGVALATADRPVTVTAADGGPAAEQGTYRSRAVIVFDERTGALLARMDQLTRPGGRYAQMRPGLVIEYSAVRSQGWSDTRPEPSDAPPFG